MRHRTQRRRARRNVVHEELDNAIVELAAARGMPLARGLRPLVERYGVTDVAEAIERAYAWAPVSGHHRIEKMRKWLVRWQRPCRLAAKNPRPMATWFVWDNQMTHDVVTGFATQQAAEQGAWREGLDPRDPEVIEYAPRGIKVAGRYLKVGEAGYFPYDTSFEESIFEVF